MPMNDQSQRTILPKIQTQESQLSGSASDDQAGAQSSPSPRAVRSVPQARSNIRSACLACRQRRSKCTGGFPCNRCESLNTGCVYDEGHDRRTRAIREKGREELELHRKVLDGIFDAIRSGGNSELLALVRENAPLSEIAAAIDGDLYVSEQNSREKERPTDEMTRMTDLNYPGVSTVHGHQLSISDTESMADFSKPSSQVPGPTSIRSFTSQAPSQPSREDPTYRHMLLPLHDYHSAILEHLSQFYLQFRNFGAQVIGHGILQDNVLGTTDIRCELIFRPQQPSDPSDIYAWASAVVNQFPDMDIFFRLAWLVLLVRFMRWYIGLSKPDFEALPEIMRPTSMQISVPHAPFIDLAPLPMLRDALIQSPRDFGEALRLSGVDVGWKHPLEDALCQDLVHGGLIVSQAFQVHVSEATNYTFGRTILRNFSELKNLIAVSDQDYVAPTPYLSPLH